MCKKIKRIIKKACDFKENIIIKCFELKKYGDKC